MIFGPGKRISRAFALCLFLLGPMSASAETITVFAAASLKTVLDALSADYAAQSPHELRLSFAGSSALARQIQLGAPADVFISANPGWMDVLQEDSLLVPDSRIDVIGNRLVVIAPAPEASPLDLLQPEAVSDRLSNGPLAMALVAAVPAGIYGKEALEALGHWPAVAQDVAQTDNVRAALALVSAGEAPLGVVYASDVMADPDVAIVAEIPASAHVPIIYPGAVIDGGQQDAATDFLRFLKTPEAQAVFAAQGFRPVGG